MTVCLRNIISFNSGNTVLLIFSILKKFLQSLVQNTFFFFRQYLTVFGKPIDQILKALTSKQIKLSS